MALTATASLHTRRSVIRSLHMQKPAIVYISPEKDNIVYSVGNKASIAQCFGPIANQLIEDHQKLGRTIIFCRTYDDVIEIHDYFQTTLGEHCTSPKGSPNYIVNRVIDMYTHSTHPTVKNKLLKQFTKPSCLRIIIATIAFGMGIDCPDVRQIVHWGVPEDVEMYVRPRERESRKRWTVVVRNDPKEPF